MKDNSFFLYDCSPGEYEIKIDKYKEPKLNINVDSTRTYFVRIGIRMGFWSGIPELILVDSISADPVIKNTSIKEIGNPNNPWIRPKSRIGINLNYGFGLDNIPMIVINDDKNSSISFGGGFAFGLKYGYELNKNFDLAFDVIYQFSNLIPYLSNADITFSRGITSFTPSLIIPIDEGYAMRLKLGAGMDYYWAGSLKVESDEVPGGFNDTWKYDSSLGYHLRAIFEMNMSEKWSLNYGLGWSNVKYKFKSGGNYFPTDDELGNPDGSGIDLLFGFYYHF